MVHGHRLRAARDRLRAGHAHARTAAPPHTALATPLACAPPCKTQLRCLPQTPRVAPWWTPPVHACVRALLTHSTLHCAPWPPGACTTRCARCGHTHGRARVQKTSTIHTRPASDARVCKKTALYTLGRPHTHVFTRSDRRHVPACGHVRPARGAQARGGSHAAGCQLPAARVLPAPRLPLPPSAGPRPAAMAIFSGGGRCWRGRRPTWHRRRGRLGPRRGPQPAGENGGSVQPPARWRWRRGPPGSSVGLWRSPVASHLPPHPV